MKLCISHYVHKSIPDAKFEADSPFSFGNMMSQNFPRKKGTSHKFGYLAPENENGFNFKKMSFYVQNRSSRPKIDLPMSISAIFKQRKLFSFSKFLGCLDEKRAAAKNLLKNLLKFGQNMS